MINTRINTYNPPQVSFKGFKAADKIISAIDFTSKNTPRNMSLLTITGCIAARFPFIRDRYEFKETLFRDSLTLGCLFFVAASAEKLVAWSLEKVSKRANGAENVFMGPNPKKMPSLWEAVKPFGSKYSIRSFDEIRELIPDEKLKNSILKNKAASFVAGIAFPILLLGIAIPWLNTVWTKNDIKNQKAAAGKNPMNGPVNSKLNPRVAAYLSPEMINIFSQPKKHNN